MIKKNALPYWQGVFLCLLFSVSGTVRGDCPAPGALSWGVVKTVVDGDTLTLSDGRRVRLIAINTPELANKGRPAQRLAQEARAGVLAFLAPGQRVGWVLGEEPSDRYGRMLAHIYDEHGRSLAAYLLSRGLGWHIAISPNSRNWECFRQLEQVARRERLGVWGVSAYAAREATALAVDFSGFAVVKGRVSRVTKTRGGWWIDLPGISLRVMNKYQALFAGDLPDNWAQREIEVRGWVINRRHSRAVTEAGHPPLMMQVSHPAMISVR